MDLVNILVQVRLTAQFNCRCVVRVWIVCGSHVYPIQIINSCSLSSLVCVCVYRDTKCIVSGLHVERIV